MSLDGYANKPLGMIGELSDGWSQQDWEKLEIELSRLSVAEWEDWRTAHRSEIAAFVSATPKQRLAKKWVKDHHLLAFAAAQHCVEAAELLQLVSSRCHEGLSYRAMASVAGEVHRQIQASSAAYSARETLGDDWTNLLAVGLSYLANRQPAAAEQTGPTPKR